ncbi:uncharacterized protein [Amphiura filiformis]|uniref:uncharacterized protein n=1 Tax=Amphiura filiformis TaxID=82378 RepID=UPI003B20C6B3
MLTPGLVFEALLFLCGFQLCRYIWRLFKQRWHYQKLIRDLKMQELAPAHPIWGHVFVLPTDEKKKLDALVDLIVPPGGETNSIDLSPFWLGPFTCMLMMSSPEYVKACVANADYKDNFVYDWVIPWIGDGLLTAGGPKWHRHRRLLTTGFHFEILKPYLNIFSDSADILLDKFSASEGKSMEVFKPVGLFTLDSLLKCSFSYESNCQLQGENEYINAVHELSEIITLRALKIQYLNEMIFKLSPLGRRFRKLCHIVHEKSRSTIRKCRREIEEGGEGFKGRKGKYLDFLDILLAARDEDGKGMDEEEIREEVDTFMFEGHDTTSSAIPWLMYNLAKHPEYQQKCRDEIQQLFDQKEDDRLKWDDLCNLPYLTMCIKESLRMYPPVQTILRKLVKDVKLPNQTVIAKGTTVACSIIGLHYNPEIWPNPKEFNPERFTHENIKNRHTHAFLPFSAGPRYVKHTHSHLKSIIGLHYNPEIWPNPKEFNPERFTHENIKNRHTHAFLPFSAGPRYVKHTHSHLKSIIGLHYNPEIWPNPKEFNPERFTHENIKNRHTHAFLPFSAGPRYVKHTHSHLKSIIGLHYNPEIWPNPKEFNPERFTHENIKNRHTPALLPFSAGPRYVKQTHSHLKSIIGLHYNPEIWPNPKEFNPERFTHENIKNRHTHAFLPFSAGPRYVKHTHSHLKSIIGLHYNPEIWPNPKEFNPERFTHENIKNRHTHAFLPFSAGPRYVKHTHSHLKSIIGLHYNPEIWPNPKEFNPERFTHENIKNRHTPALLPFSAGPRYVKQTHSHLKSIIGLHYNPEIWPNPKEFNPERFTHENIKNRHTHAFLPFSAGPRNCIGQHFALNEIKVVMSKMLHRFYIDVDPDRPPIWIQRLVTKTFDGMYLRFTPVENKN